MLSRSLDQLNKDVEVLETGNKTISGVKTFSSNPLSTETQSTNANALTKYSAVVKNSGNEIIAGVKTFSSSPIVPTPTAGTQVVNKNYADLKVAFSDFTGTNASVSANGYQKLPSGLIIQWGVAGISSGDTVTLPTTFPTANMLVLTSVIASSGTTYVSSTGIKTVSNFVAYHNHTAPVTIGYIAIGR